MHKVDVNAKKDANQENVHAGEKTENAWVVIVGIAPTHPSK